MDMTNKEMAVIKAAIKSRNMSRLLQPILFGLLVGALLAMYFGALSGDNFLYLSILLVLLTIASPQLGGSPKYSDLVDILEKQLPQNPTMEDVLSDELHKT